MKIRLLEDVDDTPMGSIVEVDEVTAQELIDAGKAEVFTEEEAKSERDIAIKSVMINTKKKEDKEMKFENMKDRVVSEHGDYFVGKAFQSLITGKAVAGMSEGTAADGGNLIGTAQGELASVALAGSVVYSKVSKITLGQQYNSMNVPLDASDPYRAAIAPEARNPAEGETKTASKLAFGNLALTLAKTIIFAPVTDELAQDYVALDGFLRNYMTGKVGASLDESILVGGTGGYAAIAGNANTTDLALTEAVPTVAELYTFVTSIDNRLLAGCEWFCSYGQWKYIVAALGTAANIDKQLIDVAGMKLFGYPVTLHACLNAQILFGNLSEYIAIEPQGNNAFDVSKEFYFDTDQTCYRLVHRGAGGIKFTTIATAEAGELSAFAESN